jgi:hypothetical protein
VKRGRVAYSAGGNLGLFVESDNSGFKNNFT